MPKAAGRLFKLETVLAMLAAWCGKISDVQVVPAARTSGCSAASSKATRPIVVRLIYIDVLLLFKYPKIKLDDVFKFNISVDVHILVLIMMMM